MWKKLLDRLGSGGKRETEAKEGESSAAKPADARSAPAVAASGSGDDSQVPRLKLRALRGIVTDRAELAKGTQLADAGKLTRLARYRNRLFAEAAGSGKSPYRVSLEFGDGASGKPAVRGRCSCMAARSRPYCKHASALLVLWTRSPDAFVQSDEPPARPAAGGRRKRRVKKGRKDAKELMAGGLDQVTTLVHELAGSGVATLTRERVDQIRQLGRGLREYRLRRLSARCLALADQLDDAVSGGVAGELDEVAYAGHLGDLLLTSSKVRKHTEGEALDRRYVEELIGRTWRKGDRQSIGDLDLVEYAFRSQRTPDGFRIRESRLVDLATGDHFTEKQILPAALARRTPPKPSYAGLLLPAAQAEAYPGFAPRRLHFPQAPAQRPLTSADLERLADGARSTGVTLEAFLEHRRDVFAPPFTAATVATRAIAVLDGRLLAVDEEGQGCHIEVTSRLERELASLLRVARLRAVLADVIADGVLPKLKLHAALVERRGELELVTLGGADALGGGDALAEATGGGRREARSWIDVARDAGLPAAALSLGEIREELAGAVAAGLGAFDSGKAEPLVTRLGDLRLAKLADLLAGVAQAETLDKRVSSFVKAQQLIEIALLRLASSTAVDTAELTPIPHAPSLLIREPDEALTPPEVATARLEGRLSAYEAAWHYGRYYDRVGPEGLAEELDIWADGSARAHLVDALRERPELALPGARKVLLTPCGRAAKVTAIELLRHLARGDQAGAKASEPQALLLEALAAEPGGERPLLLTALAALQGPRARGPVAAHARRLAELEGGLEELRAGTPNAVRGKAARTLAALGDRAAIGPLRRAFVEDPASKVRHEAALALAALGDVEMTDALLSLLPRSDRDGKTALVALGVLADRRALAAVIADYLEGSRPQVSAEALQGFGILALEPLLDTLEEHPALGKRQALRNVIAALPRESVEERALARLEAAREENHFPLLAKGLFQLLAQIEPTRKQVGRQILAWTEEDRRKGIKPLRNLVQKAL